jgi:hypothetical protein
MAHARRAGPPIFFGRLAAVFLALAAGCQLQTQLVPSPLSFEEQQQALLQIVPLGTSREEVIQKLEAAGVEGAFGISDSVYYCDAWIREDDTRWHLDVALLFDQSGELYKTRRGTATTGITPGGSKSPREAADRLRENLKTGTSESGGERGSTSPAATPNASTTTPDISRSDGRRTPFANPTDLEP